MELFLYNNEIKELNKKIVYYFIYLEVNTICFWETNNIIGTQHIVIGGKYNMVLGKQII